MRLKPPRFRIDASVSPARSKKVFSDAASDFVSLATISLRLAVEVPKASSGDGRAVGKAMSTILSLYIDVGSGRDSGTGL